MLQTAVRDTKSIHILTNFFNYQQWQSFRQPENWLSLHCSTWHAAQSRGICAKMGLFLIFRQPEYVHRFT